MFTTYPKYKMFVISDLIHWCKVKSILKVLKCILFS